MLIKMLKLLEMQRGRGPMLFINYKYKKSLQTTKILKFL